MGNDTTGIGTLEERLRNPATRAAAIESVARSGGTGPAVAFARWLSGDEAAISLLERMQSAGRGPTPGALLWAILGPRLRANARIRALVPKFGGRPFEK